LVTHQELGTPKKDFPASGEAAPEVKPPVAPDQDRGRMWSHYARLVRRQKLAELRVANVERLAAFALGSSIPVARTIPNLGARGHGLAPTLVAREKDAIRRRKLNHGDLHLPGPLSAANSYSGWNRCEKQTVTMPFSRHIGREQHARAVAMTRRPVPPAWCRQGGGAVCSKRDITSSLLTA
jgi:hypothetical protein